jgi:hypothetical protein
MDISKLFDQFGQRDFQRLRDAFDISKYQIPFAALDATDIGAIQTTFRCKTFLRIALLPAECSYTEAKMPPGTADNTMDWHHCLVWHGQDRRIDDYFGAMREFFGWLD